MKLLQEVALDLPQMRLMEKLQLMQQIENPSISWLHAHHTLCSIIEPIKYSTIRHLLKIQRETSNLWLKPLRVGTRTMCTMGDLKHFQQFYKLVHSSIKVFDKLSL